MKHTAYMKTALGPIKISEVDGFITELFFCKRYPGNPRRNENTSVGECRKTD